MNPSICLAIADRRVISFSYDAGPSRKIEPYRHGTSTGGEEVVFGYQVHGESKSGESLGWKLFRVARITQLVVTQDRFSATRSDFNPTDRGIAVEHCSIASSQTADG